MSELPVDGAGAAPGRLSPDALVAPPLARRMACWLYEGMLLFAVVFMAGWLFSTLAQMRSGIDPRRPLLQLFIFIVFGVYFAWFWSRGRQTLAMKTWHIGLVDASGAPVSQQRAAWRYVWCWLWFLPPLVTLSALHLGGRVDIVGILGWIAAYALSSRLHPQRQFWHDVIAGTRLVTTARGR